MSFTIKGLPAEEFEPLYGLSDEALNARGIIRKTVDASPGFPCRITLEDAEAGEQVLLLNYESHKAATPYRSAFAIYVREGARTAGSFIDELPPVMAKRPIALRIFNKDAMLIGADLGREGEETRAKIGTAFADRGAAYIHAHNAMHGCFAAAIVRSE